MATAGLDVSDVAYPVRTIFRKRRDVSVPSRRGDSRSISTRSVVVLDDGSILEYDELIVATGATAGFFGIAGAAEHSHPLYTLARRAKVPEPASQSPRRCGGPPGAVTTAERFIVVVGGGATGVETAGALVELLDASRRRGLVRARLGSHEGGPRRRQRQAACPGSTRRRAATPCETLRQPRSRRPLDAPVVEVTDAGLHLGGDHEGEVVRADLVIWAGGVTVDGTLASSMPVQRQKGGRVSRARRPVARRPSRR